jgi:hypothetical protein
MRAGAMALPLRNVLQRKLRSGNEQREGLMAAIKTVHRK